MSKFIYILFTIVLFQACEFTEATDDITAYYFPLNELKQGKVYEYKSIGSEFDPPIYWYYKSMKQDGNTYLLGMGYDPEFQPDQFVREEKVSNGMLLVDYYTYEVIDSLNNKTRIQAEIAAGNIFPFKVQSPGNVLLTSISWELAGEKNAKINHIRNRQFNKKTTYSFQEKEQSAVEFNTIELIEFDQEGRLPLEFNGTEIYAKGIGLVAFTKNVTTEYTMDYQLKDIYTMKEFESKFKTKLAQ